jgi:hypothetical protein
MPTAALILYAHTRAPRRMCVNKRTTDTGVRRTGSEAQAPGFYDILRLARLRGRARSEPVAKPHPPALLSMYSILAKATLGYEQVGSEALQADL